MSKVSLNSAIQSSSFPLEVDPFLSWLPASDTWKSEREQSGRDDNTFHAKEYPQIKRKSSLLNKQYMQKEHKKFAIGLKHQISAESHF